MYYLLILEMHTVIFYMAVMVLVETRPFTLSKKALLNPK
jgi:hypothetical protein